MLAFGVTLIPKPQTGQRDGVFGGVALFCGGDYVCSCVETHVAVHTRSLRAWQ